MIETLIDKQDNFEIIRDQVAAILALEVANQQTLATAALKDPNLWKLRIYIERANPWEAFLHPTIDESPLVNVWYENTDFDLSSSNVGERQRARGILNIDIYGYGKSANNPAGGHKAGDELAALNCQRGLRLVRNILMAAEYTYLGLRGVVTGRMPQSIRFFQPEQDNRAVQNIVASRLALAVSFNEYSPQVVLNTLEFISIDVIRAEDGEILIEADYDFTP